MKLFRTLAELAAEKRPVYLAIGVFDGVHLGHQRVINQARDAARQAGGLSVALTFDPHPIRVLRPDQAPVLLTSTAHKLALIQQLGIDACVLINFDNAFAATTAEQFIAQIAFCQHVCVGTRFHFGHNRAGNPALLEELAPRHGFTVTEIKPVLTADGEMISSTAVRQHIQAGHLDRAAVMLGRPFSILGTVEKGDGVGRQLGYPTANLNSHHEAFPPDGVYACRVQLVGQASCLSPSAVEQASRLSPPNANASRDGCPITYPGVINLGRRPTFSGRSHQRVLEVHILEFDRAIYGQELEVIFVAKLRAEQKFASVAALKTQIAADIVATRHLIGDRPQY